MKTIKKFLSRYFIDGLGAMALGLEEVGFPVLGRKRNSQHYCRNSN